MSSKYDAQETTILAELRQQAGLTQDQAGAYFGLKGKKRRDSVGNWERGRERPHHKHRAQFITYLWHTLGLRYNVRQFQKIWQDVMVGQWQWLPLNRDELPMEDAPFQAIAAIPYFVGREQELNDIKAAVLSNHSSPIAALHGIGGVGKTTLAAQAAYRLRPYFPDGVLWARLDVSDTMSVLTTFANAYGHDVNQYPDLDSRSRVVRGILAHKRTLIVLDNVQRNEQVEPLLPPTTGSSAVIVTTRQTNLPALLGAHWLHVEPFPQKTGETLQLFAQILGQAWVTQEKTALAEMADLLGHLPLAVAIVAGRLLNEPDRPVSNLLRQLRRKKERLGELVYGEWSVKTAFNISYEGLAPDLQQFFAALGVFGGEDFAVTAVAEVTETPVAAARHNLGKLYELSLVQQRQPGRYQLHPLLRDYAREKIATNAPFARMAVHYNQVLYEARRLYEQGDDGVQQGLALFDLERANIQAGQSWATTDAAEDREALRLCCDYPLSGGFLIHLRLHPEEIIRWYESGLVAARRLKKRADEGRHLTHLGQTCHDLGQFHESVAYYQQALPIFQELHDRHNECNALDKLGLVTTRLGQFKQAITYHEQALSIAREIDDKQRESNALGNLGVAYKNLGQFRQALQYHEQALATARERGDLQGTGASLNDLANTHLELNKPHRSIELYKQALPIVRQIGDRQTESNVLGNLGWAYASLKEFSQAIEFYEQALTIDRQMNNRHGEGITLSNLGEAYLDLDQPNRAITLHKEALSIAVEIGSRVGEGEALGGLGSAYHHLGQLARAEKYCRQALGKFEESNYLLGQAAQLRNLSRICRQLGREDEAQAYSKRHELIRNKLEQSEADL